jgi:hypothetical protein
VNDDDEWQRTLRVRITENDIQERNALDLASAYVDAWRACLVVV